MIFVQDSHWALLQVTRAFQQFKRRCVENHEVNFEHGSTQPRILIIFIYKLWNCPQYSISHYNLWHVMCYGRSHKMVISDGISGCWTNGQMRRGVYCKDANASHMKQVIPLLGWHYLLSGSFLLISSIILNVCYSILSSGIRERSKDSSHLTSWSSRWPRLNHLSRFESLWTLKSSSYWFEKYCQW